MATCPPAATEGDLLNLEDCPGAIGNETCATGYSGHRCSVCTPMDPTKECTSDIVNGYYRLNEECLPCPCTIFTIWTMIPLGFLLILLIMISLDHVLGGVAHMSTLMAPVTITISMVQTLYVLLEMELTWPRQLRQFFKLFAFLNLNIQLARPECSGRFSIEDRLVATLAMPFGIFLLLAVYAVVKMAIAKYSHADEDAFRADHEGRGFSQATRCARRPSFQFLAYHTCHLLLSRLPNSRFIIHPPDPQGANYRGARNAVRVRIVRVHAKHLGGVLMYPQRQTRSLFPKS